jgi:hypothetical protein
LRVVSYARPAKLFTASYDLVTGQPATLTPEMFRRVLEAVVEVFRASLP